MPITAGGREIPTRGLTLTQDQQDRISRTLNRVPAAHLRSLQYLSFRDRDVRVRDAAGAYTGETREYAGGSTSSLDRGWQAMDPAARRFMIMLDIDSFDPAQRAINARVGGLHYTLLHELGHLVDWSYSAFDWIRRNDPEGFAAIAQRDHSGITHGAQERFADVYADLIFYSEGQRPTNRAMQAVLASPAFSSVPGFRARMP
jgi:hypothetical protein